MENPDNLNKERINVMPEGNCSGDGSEEFADHSSVRYPMGFLQIPMEYLGALFLGSLPDRENLPKFHPLNGLKNCY